MIEDPTALTPEILDDMDNEVKKIKEEAIKQNPFMRLIFYHQDHPQTPILFWTSIYLPDPENVIVMFPTETTLYDVVYLIIDPKHEDMIRRTLPFVRKATTFDKLARNPLYKGQSFKEHPSGN